jgi:hypothetical protein
MGDPGIELLYRLAIEGATAKTDDVLDSMPLPEPAASPHIVAPYGEKIAIHMGMTETACRYFGDPEAKKLSADDGWVVRPLEKG